MQRLAVILTLAVVSVSATARAQDAEKEKPAAAETAQAAPASDAHYPPPSTRLKVLGTGVFLTAAAWGVAFGVARAWPELPCVLNTQGGIYVYPGTTATPCSSGPPGSTQLQIPIVGPWLALAKSGCAVDEPNCSVAKPVLRGVGYVVDGVVQLGGLALIAEALVMKTESAADPAKKTSAFALHYRGIEVAPVPMVSPGVSGMSVVGTF